GSLVPYLGGHAVRPGDGRHALEYLVTESGSHASSAVQAARSTLPPGRRGSSPVTRSTCGWDHRGRGAARGRRRPSAVTASRAATRAPTVRPEGRSSATATASLTPGWVVRMAATSPRFTR